MEKRRNNKVYILTRNESKINWEFELFGRMNIFTRLLCLFHDYLKYTGMDCSGRFPCLPEFMYVIYTKGKVKQGSC
ncbi:MAG: hypothetical protein PHX78_11340 [bacterium]|nr:hypothetical protein [bacterium]